MEKEIIYNLVFKDDRKITALYEGEREGFYGKIQKFQVIKSQEDNNLETIAIDDDSITLKGNNVIINITDNTIIHEKFSNN